MNGRKIREGMTAQASIDLIRSSYGYRLSVMQIIDLMMFDRRTKVDGSHTNLR